MELEFSNYGNCFIFIIAKQKDFENQLIALCTFITVRRSSLSPKYNIVQHDNNYMAGKVIFDITLSDIRSGCHVVPKFLG